MTIEIPNFVSLARFDRLWNDLKAAFGADIFDESCRHACRMIDDLLTVRESLERVEQAEKYRTSKLLLPNSLMKTLPTYTEQEQKDQVVLLSIYGGLLQDIERMRVKHKDICDRLIQRFVAGVKDAASPEQYRGARKNQRCIRFELSTAHELSGHGYEFSNPDKPDFVLGGKYRGVAIECTSRYVAETDNISEATIEQAVNNCVNDKLDKPYANNALALFIDFTNVAHVAGQKQYGPEISKRYRAEAVQALAGCKGKIGAIVFCHYRIEPVHVSDFFKCKAFNVFEEPIIAEHCAPLLRDFLNDYKSKNTLFDTEAIRKTRQQDFAR